MKPHTDKILIIKLGALGDFVQSLSFMAAIRKSHPEAHITLLTTKLFKEFGNKCNYFDEVIIDKKPKRFDILGWFNLKKLLIKGNFSRIYDLQNNDRTSFYLKLFPKNKKPEWIGAAKGASHRNASKERTSGHAFDGHVQTLSIAGISDIEIDNLRWVKEDISKFNIHEPYILIVSGCSPQHLQKRMPAQKYGEIAVKLSKQGYNIVLLGTELEKENINIIKNICPKALDLSGKTSLFQIAALANNACGALGNDTGPMHIIAATGCPSLVLFSSHSNPLHHIPKGKCVKSLQENDLSNVSVDTVYKTLISIIR